MYQVRKRSGLLQDLQREKLERRISRLCTGLDTNEVNPKLVVDKIIDGVFDGIDTDKLDNLAAETAAYMSTQHPDYSILAGRIAVTLLHKKTKSSFTETMKDLYEYVDPKSNLPSPLLADDVYQAIIANAERLDKAINYERDLTYDYFGFKTLERSYLLKLHGQIVERPQHMLLRVSVGIHSNNIDAAIETYELLSQGWFTHASPTLFNSGTPRNQLSSCFLLTMQSDSIEGIYDTLKQCAQISKSAGGIGLSVHNIRASGSYIRGTNGTSNGLVPMLRVFNDTARYVDQGGGKRKGAFAVYLEPWHADIFEFLDLRKNTGKEENRARDLFYALWIPDLFMKRVEASGDWSLFCPNEAPGLADVWGEEFEALYTRYEREGRARRTVKAQELWFAILDSQIETGTPYMLYKDSCNRKSNQQNLGTIRSSNLCTEIIQYTSPDEIAVCNLASIALPRFVTPDGFDFKKLFDITYTATVNLNRIIDINYYPVPQARNSNMKHRPIGLGVQGLADVFLRMRLPFESDEARKLNIDIFETLYFAALTASKDLAKRDGPYESYQGSPASKGLLQFDLWNVEPASAVTGRWDWAGLKREIAQYGLRNSLLVAPMPTASTSQILGNNEAFEPYTSNIYTRRVLAGEFPVVNKHLVKDLIKLGLWNFDIRNKIIAHNGSIQNIEEIPADIKEIYKTVWEIKQRSLIDMAADRAPYIDQSQSFNVFIPQPTIAKLTAMHFYGWKKGLKTGMYYLRTRPAADAIQFTVNQEALVKKATGRPSSEVAAVQEPKINGNSVEAEADGPVCRMEEGCVVCGS